MILPTMRRLGAVGLAALLFLGPAQATVSLLLDAVTTTNATPPLGRIVQPVTGGFVSSNQSFTVYVIGSGSVSCTVQIVGANDAAVLTGDTTQWVSYGTTIVASGTTSGINYGYGTSAFQYFGAEVTAISGSNAKCTVKINA